MPEEALDSLIKTKKKTEAASENNYDKIPKRGRLKYYSVNRSMIYREPSRKAIFTLPRHIAMFI